MKRELPKNVRQIGNVSSDSKIYVEDYVDTFFNQLCDKTDQEPIGAFLVGERVRDEEKEFIYVYGAIRMEQLECFGQEVQVADDTWKMSCEICKQYFENGEILGWFLSVPEITFEVTHCLRKMHEKLFPREKSLFVLKKKETREEQFYIYQYRELMECGGHYIYYEKNLEMQNYMIASRRQNGVTPSEYVADQAAKNFRSIINEKMNRPTEKMRSKMVYGVVAVFAAVLIFMGGQMVHKLGTVQKFSQSLQMFSKAAWEKSHQQVVEANEKVDEPVAEEVIKQDEIYVVEKGDTLVTISKKIYGDDSHVEAICKMNGLEDGNLIFIGQKLLLP